MATRKQDKTPDKGKTTCTVAKTAQMPRASIAKSAKKKAARKSAAKPIEEKIIQTHKGKGRPTKFTPEVTSKILTAIRAGNYIETAAAWAGVNKQTIYDWLRQGAAQEKGPFRDFSDSVGEALAHAEVADLQNVAEAAKKGNWQAAAWRLERRNPSRWGRKDRTPVAPEDEIDYDNLSDEELEHVIATGRLPDKR